MYDFVIHINELYVIMKEKTQEENKIQTLQKEFIDKLRGMTIQEAKFVLEPIMDYVNSTSIVQ